MDEQAFKRGEYPLHSLNADVPQKFAAGQMQDLHRHKQVVYDMKANWKLRILNYNECWHCPLLHPALNRVGHRLN